jgi:hypothetical protein
MKKLIFFLFVFMFVSSSWANEARDKFVREIVIQLIESRNSHVNISGYVKEAVDGWCEYQRLVNGEKK